ncbi:NADH:flavin oxidoreductase [Candidatus Scalindua japonica]|uniref:NADH:flavin oxidoreductase n=1 Tax=Candidatus Scalindua japonica TaxID=1284222 RepID=A0A286U0T9_9BACT|nr:hypothetical protein [Candidatus Scalindua japonica]GAX61726.1 NADH:flavin oxidoreductase [Candidatus Scalindua japonica]
MSLKIFVTILFFFSFVCISVSNADVPVLRKMDNEENSVSLFSDKRTKKGSANAYESLRELEKEMKSGVDDISFPVMFSKYLTGCMDLNEHKKAKGFFLTLAEENPKSPHAITAKGIVTYGWWAENVLRHGLKKIDEAILIDKEAFFPRLCRAIYLSCLPGKFTVSIDEFNTLLETEKENTSNLLDVYSNLIRVYGEHGHYDIIEQVNKKLQKTERHIFKKINYSNTKSIVNIMYDSEIIKPHYPIVNNANTKRTNTSKDKHLSGDLTILEKSMERKVDDEAFGDIYKRYILLINQYQEANRAINFFENLTERYPQSPNALAASGMITYGLKGQILLQKGLVCIKSAIELEKDNFFSRISHATFNTRFPYGFMRSMRELSFMKQAEAGVHHRVRLINKRIELICSQHGHDSMPTENNESVIMRRL